MSELKDYIAMYQTLHQERGAFEGRSLMPYAHLVKRLVRQTAAETVLDYGCGKGLQYSVEECDRWWNTKVTLYDPAVPMFSSKPLGTFDGVVCSDVLEHIPEAALPEVLTDLFAYATRFLFVTICCREANRKLPNGKNAHCTIRAEEWWKHMLDTYRYNLCKKKGNDWPTVQVEFTP